MCILLTTLPSIVLIISIKTLGEDDDGKVRDKPSDKIILELEAELEFCEDAVETSLGRVFLLNKS